MRRFVMACAATMLAFGLNATAQAGDEVKSGLQPGDRPGAFNVLDCTGPSKGEKLCYRCRYGSRPVVSVFARELNPELASLVSKIDKVVGANEEKKAAAFVVLMTDDIDAAEGKLQAFAKQHEIKNIPLTLFDGTAGPPSYKLNKDADLTVLMWSESDVKVNHAFKGTLDKKSINKVVRTTNKILGDQGAKKKKKAKAASSDK